MLDNLKTSNNILYYFDEITYCNFLDYYVTFNDLWEEINFIFFRKSRYIITTEIFKNDNLQTIGNNIFYKEFGIIFFKYSELNILCNYENIQILKSNNIYENVVYYPSIFKFKFEPSLNNNKYIDILIYGNNNPHITKYRNLMINKVKEYSRKNKYIFWKMCIK